MAEQPPPTSESPRPQRREPKVPPDLEVLLLLEEPALLTYISRRFPKELVGIVEPSDVLQDTYFDACRSAAGFVSQDQTSVHRWLVTIARNRLAHLLRVRRAAKRGGGAGNVLQ